MLLSVFLRRALSPPPPRKMPRPISGARESQYVQRGNLRRRSKMHRSFLLGLIVALLFGLPARAEILTLTHGEVQIRDIRAGDTGSKDIDTVLLGNSAVVEVTP